MLIAMFDDADGGRTVSFKTPCGFLITLYRRDTFIIKAHFNDTPVNLCNVTLSVDGGRLLAKHLANLMKDTSNAG